MRPAPVEFWVHAGDFEEGSHRYVRRSGGNDAFLFRSSALREEVPVVQLTDIEPASAEAIGRLFDDASVPESIRRERSLFRPASATLGLIGRFKDGRVMLATVSGDLYRRLEAQMQRGRPGSPASRRR